MSYQTRGKNDVVMCDLCQQIGAVGDRRFRLLRKSAAGTPQHLCPACRIWAIWCETHQQYHRPDDLHRAACAACSGLYTSRLDHNISYCPSCYRERFPPVPTAPLVRQSNATQPQRGPIAALFAQLGLISNRRR